MSSKFSPYTLLAAFAFASAPLLAADIVEYYHKDLDHYFMTGYAPEIQALDAGVQKGWARTGFTFRTYNAGESGVANSVPVCRFYGNPLRGLDSHFYSASSAECVAVKQKFPEEWLLESDDFFRVHAVDPNTGACPASTKAVYRLYNRRSDVNHRYTTDPSIVDSMLAKGYVLEGNGSPSRPVVFCAANLPPAQPVAGAPVCTLTGSTPFPVIGTPVTLTATCTDSPTTYAWINCTATGATCTASATTAGAVNYSLVATNSRGTSAPASISLNWQIAASAGPTCTVSASTPTPQIGSPLVLNGNCSNAPTKFDWASCSALLVNVCNLLSECATSTTTCSPIGTQQGPIFYSLVASNSAGASVRAGVNVDWQSGGTSTPPPPTTPTPTCTITPSSTTPAVNTTLTLTASCNNTPTAFQWSGCSSTTSTCTTTETTPVTRNYTVTASNAAGVGFPATASVTWQQPPTAPPVCTLSANNPNPYIGGSVTLTASCTQSPTGFQWTGCTGSTGATCTAFSSTLGVASYSVTASNQFGPGSPASVSVNWQNPPPAGADFCGSYPNVVRVNLPWGSYLDTVQNGGFPANAVLVGSLTVPAGAAGTTVPGLVSVVEYIDGQANRMLSISPSACDFRGFTPGVYPPVDPLGVNSPMGWDFGINPNKFFTLTTMPGGGVKLEPGRTYYVNIRNVDYGSGQVSCRTTNCNVRITVNRPQ